MAQNLPRFEIYSFWVVNCGEKKSDSGRRDLGWNHVPDTLAIQQILSAYVVAALPVLSKNRQGPCPHGMKT